MYYYSHSSESIEERVLDLQEHKDAMTEEAMEGRLTPYKLSLDDLRSLLGRG